MTKTFRTLNDRDHALKLMGNILPGGIGNITEKGFIYNMEKKKMIYSEYTYNNCLLHLIKEALENVYDESKKLKKAYPNDKSRQVTLIKVKISDIGITSVYNNGVGIPIKKETEKLRNLQSAALNHDMTEEQLDREIEHWNIHKIFGFLRTGSNFNERGKVIGVNGLGAKVISLCSDNVMIENYNIDQNMKYMQIYKNQLETISKPTIKEYTKQHKKKGYTKITWYPKLDYAKAENGYTDDDMLKIRQMIIDFSFHMKLPISFNSPQGELEVFDYSTPMAYMNLYVDTKVFNHLYISTKDTDVYLFIVNSQTKFKHISYVNGVKTTKGDHIKKLKQALIKPIIEDIKKNGDYKDVKLTTSSISKFFFMFSFSEISNVDFNGQNKSETRNIKITTRDLTSKELKTIKRWDIYQDILNSCRSKIINKSNLKTKKKKQRVDIAKLTDATHAGGKNSHNCKLVIAEGDSAITVIKAVAPNLQGGTDGIGWMPIRGKLLNVLNASDKKIFGNRELQMLNEALGGTLFLDYSKEENYKKLRYGEIWVMADSDVDGDHIRCLIYNALNYMYPGLLEHKNFFGFVRTVAVKVEKLGLTFYSEAAYNKWYETNNKTFKKGEVKY